MDNLSGKFDRRQKLAFRSAVTLLTIYQSLHLCSYIEEADRAYESKEALEQFYGPDRSQWGVIPEWIPESSRSIKTAADMDSGEQVLALQYSTDEDWDVPSTCYPRTIREIKNFPGFRRLWWPLDIRWEGSGYQIYLCVDRHLNGNYLAIGEGQLFYWLGPRR